jgi:WD40 repeat protein
MAFVPEISWCLLTGSWDSTIRMWDIRSGKQMTTIKDHNSDVYAITFNPARPFTFASCSRDTTIRLFSIDGMISKLKMQLFFNEKLSSQDKQIFDTPMNQYNGPLSYKLSSERAHNMIKCSETGKY